ncbi:unnamed protein product [Heterobilharzia americana]|nr:unnamed protein product [Heterobilharzia americana]
MSYEEYNKRRNENSENIQNAKPVSLNETCSASQIVLEHDPDKVKSSMSTNSAMRLTNRAWELRMQACRKNSASNQQLGHCSHETTLPFQKKLSPINLQSSLVVCHRSAMGTFIGNHNQPTTVRNLITPNIIERNKTKIPISNYHDAPANISSQLLQTKIPCPIPLTKSSKTGDHIELLDTESTNRNTERNEKECGEYKFNEFIFPDDGNFQVDSQICKGKNISSQRQNYPTSPNTDIWKQLITSRKEECECTGNQDDTTITKAHKEVQTYFITENKEASDADYPIMHPDNDTMNQSAVDYAKKKIIHRKRVETSNGEKYSPMMIFHRVKEESVSQDGGECKLSTKSDSCQLEQALLSHTKINYGPNDVKQKFESIPSNSELSSDTLSYRKKIHKIFLCLSMQPSTNVKPTTDKEKAETTTNLVPWVNTDQGQTVDHVKNSKYKQSSDPCAHNEKVNRQITGLYHQHDQGVNEAQREFHALRRRLTDISEKIDNIYHQLSDHKMILDTITRAVESNKSVYTCNNRLFNNKYDDQNIDDNQHSQTITPAIIADDETDWIDSNTGDDRTEICTGHSPGTNSKCLPVISKDIQHVVNDTMKQKKVNKNNLSEEEYTIITENNSHISSQLNKPAENNKKQYHPKNRESCSSYVFDETQNLGVFSLDTKIAQTRNQPYDYQDADSLNEIIVHKEVVSSDSVTSSPPTLTYIQQKNTGENLSEKKSLQHYYCLAYLNQDAGTSSEFIHAPNISSNNKPYSQLSRETVKKVNELLQSKHPVPQYNTSADASPASYDAANLPVGCGQKQQLHMPKSTRASTLNRTSHPIQYSSRKYTPQKYPRIHGKHFQNSIRQTTAPVKTKKW